MLRIHDLDHHQHLEEWSLVAGLPLHEMLPKSVNNVFINPANKQWNTQRDQQGWIHNLRQTSLAELINIIIIMYHWFIVQLWLLCYPWFFWWIWLPMGSLKKFSRVVLMTTLSKKNNMQISAAIIKNRILFNNFFVINGNVRKIVSIPIFSWSRITINIFIEF